MPRIHRMPPHRLVRSRRGHVYSDFVILHFILIGAAFFLQGGLHRHFLPAILFGAWGLTLVVTLPLAFLFRLETLGEWIGEAVMLTAAAYLVVPLLALAYSAFVLPFGELGFSA